MSCSNKIKRGSRGKTQRNREKQEKEEERERNYFKGRKKYILERETVRKYGGEGEMRCWEGIFTFSAVLMQ